jgi:hypothetical protein
MTPSRKKRTRGAYLAAAFLVLAAFLVVLVLKKYQGRHAFPPAPAAPEAATHSVVLFFGGPTGEGLVREAREADPCDDTSECIRDVIEELVNGPLDDLSPVLPPQTTVLDVAVSGDTATVDFGPELQEGLPEGASAEMLAAYSIVDTVAVNFPQIRRVRITVGGKPVGTLREHLDLREALAPDFSLEVKPETGAKKEEKKR